MYNNFSNIASHKKVPLNGLLETVTHIKWAILLASSRPLGPRASTSTERGISWNAPEKQEAPAQVLVGSLRVLATPPCQVLLEPSWRVWT